MFKIKLNIKGLNLTVRKYMDYMRKFNVEGLKIYLCENI